MEAPVILNLKRGPIGRPQKRPTKDLLKVFIEKVNPKAPREGRLHREEAKKGQKKFYPRRSQRKGQQKSWKQTEASGWSPYGAPTK